MLSYKLYIDGKLVEGEGRKVPVDSPGLGEVIGEISAASSEQAQQALEAARDAFPAWSKLSVEERGAWMMKLRDTIHQHRDKLADILSHEAGKPVPQAMMEVDNLERALEFYFDQAKSNYDTTVRDPQGKALNLSLREPLGVIVGYLAWNFPLSNLSTKLGPVLASGCTAVLKPATRTPLSTLYIGELMHGIGFPKGVINFVAGSAKEISTVLTASDIPAMLSLIGSSQAGRELVRDSATSIKRFSLELGGNAPVIVAKSADIELAADVLAGGKFRNCGQICVSPQRVFVESSVHDALIAALKARFEEAKCGTLHEEGANVGPMITPQSVTRMEALVADAVDKGATLVVGGKRPAYKDKGNYFLPTLLDNVTDDMLVFREEVFGPILSVMAYDDLDKALEMANDTEYGLYSYAFSRDLAEVNKIVRGIHAGTVSVNGAGGGPHLPHGGVKESGVGKDGSHYALDEYYYIKSVRIALS
jgi:succinate-semialdehyde dehydrogenase/glutarate-semialdehyde dehydrogenase